MCHNKYDFYVVYVYVYMYMSIPDNVKPAQAVRTWNCPFQGRQQKLKKKSEKSNLNGFKLHRVIDPQLEARVINYCFK